MRQHKEDLWKLKELSRTIPNDPELQSILPEIENKIDSYTTLANQGIEQIQVKHFLFLNHL